MDNFHTLEVVGRGSETQLRNDVRVEIVSVLDQTHWAHDFAATLNQRRRFNVATTLCAQWEHTLTVRIILTVVNHFCTFFFQFSASFHKKIVSTIYKYCSGYTGNFIKVLYSLILSARGLTSDVKT